MKRLIELALVGSGIAGGVRRLRRPTAILAYHNVVPTRDAGRGDTSLHITVERFIEQIERLSRTHDIVPLSRMRAEGPGRPRAIITFDDAYRGAVTHALPALRARGLPATVFVAPALLGAVSTWWDEMAEAGVLDETRRRHALEELQGRGEVVRGEHARSGSARTLPDSYAIASLEELRLQCTDGITIASHSWAHEYLPALEPDALRVSLESARRWVAESGLPWVDWLALPYGGGSPEVEAAALRAGHRGVLRVDGGTAARSAATTCLPRINVPAGMTSRGLELRTSGLV